MLNKIVKRFKKDLLEVTHLPLPYPLDVAAVRHMTPSAVAKLVDSEVFEFKLENPGIRVDIFEKTHYPLLTEDELKDAADCPMPHAKVALSIDVPRADSDELDNYLWYIERTGHGYFAIPFVYRCDVLLYCGASLVLDRRYTNNDGTPVLHYRVPFSHGAVYDNVEFIDHHHVILGFLRTLCQPAVIIESEEPNERLNRARARRRRPVRPPRRVVRLPAEIHRMPQAADNERAQAFGPKAAHHRRSHRRVLASGRAIWVRSCVVNAANGEPPPPPQRFRVDNPENNPHGR